MLPRKFMVERSCQEPQTMACDIVEILLHGVGCSRQVMFAWLSCEFALPSKGVTDAQRLCIDHCGEEGMCNSITLSAKFFIV